VTTRRSDIVDAESPGVYHCISRCVRREALIADPARRAWVVARLEFLTRFAAVDVISFAVMENHLHLLLGIRPDVVRDWSDREVAFRRLSLLPNRRGRTRPSGPAQSEPTLEDINALLASPARLRDARRDLSSLGFFHRLLKEPCARLWNREDGVTGHFWEGRYKSPRVLDERALLEVSTYIELNEVRACAAESVPGSVWTSARTQWDRLCQAARDASIREANGNENAIAVLQSVRWTPAMPFSACPYLDLQTHHQRPPLPLPRYLTARRSLVDYVDRVDSVGRVARNGKPGRIPAIQPVAVGRAISQARVALGTASALASAAAARLSSWWRDAQAGIGTAFHHEFSTAEPDDDAMVPRGSCYGSPVSIAREALRRGKPRLVAIPLRTLR